MGFDPKAFRGKRACVLGLGRSGLGAARLLRRKGWSVLVHDAKPRKGLPLAERLPRGIVLECAGRSEKAPRCGFAVKSPGILPAAPILERLREASVPVFSEIEVALAFCPSREVIAVTGTNGKTTTAHMTAALLRAARRRVHLLGNVGVPLSRGVGKVREGDAVVLEVSSYQLEDSSDFRPAAAALLNITSDHVDHHGSMEAYISAKARVFQGMDPEGVCVFNADDPLAFSLSRRASSRKLFFSRTPSAIASAWLQDGGIAVRLPGGGKTLLLPRPGLPGEHNADNAMAAALLALSAGVPARAAARGLRAFRGVEHRIEDCGRVRGLRCINDSKGTNVDSTIVALQSVPGPILLILGGLAKPGGFAALRPLVERCVKGVLTIGSAAAKIEADLEGAAPIFPCRTMETAVSTALRIARKGDALLLSPACASMDQFRDYEHRGEVFKSLLEKARKAPR
jgi:UDP-N-acetylmuramoylalanine--D-glutamate ligase